MVGCSLIDSGDLDSEQQLFGLISVQHTRAFLGGLKFDCDHIHTAYCMSSE